MEEGEIGDSPGGSPSGSWVTWAAPPSSEVGSVYPRSFLEATSCDSRPDPLPRMTYHANPRYEEHQQTNDHTRSLLGSELRDLLTELVNNLHNRHPQPLPIPSFNPKGDIDPKSWLHTVEMCFFNNPRASSDLIVTLSKALRGTAAVWFSRISHERLTWEEFKTAFLHEYVQVDTPASTFASQMDKRPKDTEEYVSIATEMLGNLNARFKDSTKEEIFISFVLAHLGKFDKRIRHLVYSKDIKTREELIRELKVVSIGKRRPGDETLSNPETKRAKPYCTHCKISGHHYNECRTRRSAAATPHQRTPTFKPNRHPSRGSQEPKQVTCYRCQQPGHYSSRCPQKKESESRPSEKRVGLCTVNPIGELEHSGERFNFIFDSGSECSLMSNSMSAKFEGHRTNKIVSLYGLGQSVVPCTIQVQTKVTINDNEIMVLFHIVPDAILPEPIVIGREILNDNLTVEINKNCCTLIRKIPIDPQNSSCKNKNESSTCQSSSTIENLGLDPSELDLFTYLCNVSDKEYKTRDQTLKRSDLDPVRVGSVDTYNAIVTELHPNLRGDLITILEKYKPFFIVGIPKNRVKTGEMFIRLKDPSKVNSQKPYRLGDERREEVRKLVNELLEANVIRPSRSPYASPAFPVPKNTGGYRLCVDYRALNANTVSEKFPLPLIQDQIARLKGAKFFSSLDMASGYHQIPIHPDSIEKTSFITYHGTWEYLAVPFGLKNAGSVFQRAVLEALGDLAHDFVVVFIDDILIVSESPEQALSRLDTTLKVLTDAGFSLNLTKCSFVVNRISYLGYEIENGQLYPNAKKIMALTNLPPPKTLRSLRQFLGLASYFRQFIRNFSIIASPLFKLIKEANSLDTKIIKWLPSHEKVRQVLITHLTSSPVLMIFNPALPIELHTDASALGYGGILINIVDGKPHAVAYYSKRTTPTESHYHSYELETMAVVKSIHHFNCYLQGRHFKVVTDCQSLKATHTKKDLIPRVQRWWSFLQSYDFTIEYRKAERMSHVDYLSRNPVESEDSVSPEILDSTKVTELNEETSSLFPDIEVNPTVSTNSPAPPTSQARPHGKKSNHNSTRVESKRINLTQISSQWLLVEQNNDPDISKIREQIKNSEIDENVRNTYDIRKGILCRKIQRNGQTRVLPIVPHSLKWAIVNNVHNSLFHMSWEKTLETLYNHYWFEKMAKFTRKFVENCLTCKVSKTDSGAKQIELHPIPKVKAPWHTMHLDTTGKLSGKNDAKEYLFVFIDAFTKYTLLIHTKNIDAESAVCALKHVTDLFGPPTLLIVDQGRSFANKRFKDYCHQSQIELHYIATGSCRANGQVERQMRVLKNMLTVAEADEAKSWQQAIGDIQLAINTAPHRVTKTSPMELMFGRVARPRELIAAEGDIADDPSVNLEEVRNLADKEIQKSASYSKSLFDKGKARVKPFRVGDLVLLKNEERNQTKLDPKYKGPYKIKSVLKNDRYEITSIDGRKCYKYPHDRIRLIPSTTELNPLLNLSDSETDENEGDNESE
ncbi:hypothetical protein M8J77_005524 [Diaphorina citri]|nr:hypothetical protein M8J77_005524 [Diaphorina citri]